MPRKLREGDTVKGWRISSEIHVGPLAMSYAAFDYAGSKCFLKLYKSPTRTVQWYNGFIQHQRLLRDYIERGPARMFTVRVIDAFEGDFGTEASAFFQAFEFIEGGVDLERVTAQIRENTGDNTWDMRVTMAKVLMAGVAALHDSGVVHGDLKPANVQLFPDPSILARYRLKLIDMDYSVLVDRLAPWHGYQGYVGTPGYFSPEHLAGLAPVKASDVFTCGLILCELLSLDGHPYPYLSDDDYRNSTAIGTAMPPRLAGSFGSHQDSHVTAIIHRCLAPRPEDRPTAREVHAALTGQTGPSAAPPDKPKPRPKPATTTKAVAPTPPPSPSPLPTPTPPPRLVPTPPTANKVHPLPPRDRKPTSGPSEIHLEVLGAPERRLRFTIRTSVGRALLSRLGEDARFAHEDFQFALTPTRDGWFVEPNSAAKNETLLNGRCVVTPQPLKTGDILALGREASGVVKLPLRVHVASSEGSV